MKILPVKKIMKSTLFTLCMVLVTVVGQGCTQKTNTTIENSTQERIITISRADVDTSQTNDINTGTAPTGTVRTDTANPDTTTTGTAKAETTQDGISRETEYKTTSEKLRIALSILPYRYFVERIGGDTVETLVLVGPGQEPHSYEPSPRQIKELGSATAWILSNVEFEIALQPKIQKLYPSLRLVDGTEGVTFRLLEEDTDNAHTDATTNLDRHTWLGKQPAILLATHIKDLLVELAPQRRALYEQNYTNFINEIESVFTDLRTALAPLRGSRVYVFHPAFGYFLDEFGIHQEAVEVGGKEPSTRELAQLIQKARQDGVRVLFVQAQFPVHAAKTLAEQIGAEVVPLDPLAPDWLDNIKRMGEALKKAAMMSR